MVSLDGPIPHTIIPASAFEVSQQTKEKLQNLVNSKEIDPKIRYPIHYTQQNLERVYSNLTTDQDKINKIMWNIYKGFKLYAPRLNFVTDNLLIEEDYRVKSFYVIDGKITEMFIDRTTTMREVPVGAIGNQGIFFTRDEKGAKRLYNELEKWVAEQEISKF